MLGGFDRDVPHQEGVSRWNEVPADACFEVPVQLDVLPDGRETLVVGDVEHCKDFNHLQGDNSLGFQGTCGLVSCEDVLRQFGIQVNEDFLVQFAAERGLCSESRDPAVCGGTSEFTQAMILTDFGIPAHVEFLGSLERLAETVEHGHSVVIEVNAGVLWNDPSSFESGMPNHAVVVTGVARDPHTGELQGYFINDSGRGYPEDCGRFVGIDTMRQA